MNDALAVYLIFDDVIVSVVPEEHLTPDDAHPHADVSRPSFQEQPTRPSDSEIDAVDLGTVREIRITSATLEWSPIEQIPASDALPAHVGYDAVFVESSSPNRPEDAQVSVDVCVSFVTDSSRVVHVFTDGFSYFARLAIDEQPDEGWTAHASTALLKAA